MGTRDTSVGLEISLKDKDKAWAEAQKRELLANAWELERRAQRTVTTAGAGVLVGLLLVGGAVVYSARRGGR